VGGLFALAHAMHNLEVRLVARFQLEFRYDYPEKPNVEISLHNVWVFRFSAVVNP
jgi:hypothetical protein